VLLLNQKPYGKITVSDIARKAGIARQTFYRNYNKKNDILEQFLSKSVDLKLLTPASGEGSLVLTFDLGYMTSHKDNLRKIALEINIQKLFSLRFREWVNDLIDRYRDKLSAEEFAIYCYRIHYQIVGSLYIFADWFRNDMPLPVEKIGSLLNSVAFPDSSRYKQVPNIIIRIKNSPPGPAM
jgi:AcrR family transcriptional regulator